MADAHEPMIYCAADRDYFDAPGRIPDEDTRYPLADGEVPEGWRRGARGLWATLMPDGVRLPDQGWKIHVSATPRVAGLVLDRTAEVLLRRRVPFKFLRSERALRLISDKSMARGSSGKFITVYPADEAEFAQILGELDAAVGGMPGPYILSDLRIGAGPVHVRYGAFVDLSCADEDGLPVPALHGPSGALVPDERSPVFRLPEWVTPPPVLAADLEARSATGFAGFPYRIVRALHFTDAGGIYLARHRETDRQVVLREARPFAGIDPVADGVERLHREYRALTTLRGLPCVPEVYGLHTAWEHHFLAEEYIEGMTLFDSVISRVPVVGRAAEDDEEARRSYADWVATVIGNLARALESVHERGLCFRDVHPRNVIVRPDDSVVLVDFEFAADIESADGLRIGARGFAAPAGTTPREADAYGLWATWLFALMPMVETTAFAPDKPAQLEAAARERFGLAPEQGPRRPGAAAGDSPSTSTDVFSPDEWPATRERLIAAIHASATPERDDRLFPADWRLFQTGGHTLAHGAAGVLLALHRIGADVPAEYVDWLVRAADRARPEPGYGLYDGLYGTAAALDELQRHEDAAAIRERAAACGEPVRAGYYGGRAGVALSLCRVAERTNDPEPLERAARIADGLTTLLRQGSAEGLRMPAYAGLMYGFSGPALLFIRLHRATGEQRYLTAAREALQWDFERCVTMGDGTIQAKQGHRHLPYLDEGSAGVALVGREYLAQAEDPAVSDFVTAATLCCTSPYVREPGLLRGRAGLVAALALSGEHGEEALLRSIRNFSWHAVAKDTGLFLPGAGLTRLSADLATGSAGLLLALHTVFEGKRELDELLPVT